MKTYVAAVVVSVLSFGALCVGQDASSSDTDQSSNQSVAAAARANKQPKIDPAKEADIRRLLEIGGTKAAMLQAMAGMEQNIRPLLVNSFPPGEYRDKLIDLFLEKFHSKADPQQMIDLAVPVYDKYLSGEEVKGLIAFYSTPVGQKTVSVLPKLMSECGDAGRKWGEGIGRQSMLDVLAEHPELQKAMESAKKTQPQQQ
jgi:hypothetical protein